MRYIVGSIAICAGGKILVPGTEVAESDFPSKQAFERAVNKGLVVGKKPDKTGEGAKPDKTGEGAKAKKPADGNAEKPAADGNAEK